MEFLVKFLFLASKGVCLLFERKILGIVAKKHCVISFCICLPFAKVQKRRGVRCEPTCLKQGKSDSVRIACNLWQVSAVVGAYCGSTMLVNNRFAAMVAKCLHLVTFGRKKIGNVSGAQDELRQFVKRVVALQKYLKIYWDRTVVGKRSKSLSSFCDVVQIKRTSRELVSKLWLDLCMASLSLVSSVYKPGMCTAFLSRSALMPTSPQYFLRAMSMMVSATYLLLMWHPRCKTSSMSMSLRQ